MTVNNKLDKSFGTVGTTAGIIVFIVGLFFSFFYLSAIILVLIGAFVGFSSTSALIDYEKKRIKFANNLFGILRIGRWISIEANMKTGIKKSNVIWRNYSIGNRTLDIATNGFRIILLDADNKEIMEINKSDSLETAELEQETINKNLGFN